MSIRNDILVKNYVAGGTIAAYTIVKWDSVDLQVIQAATATDLSIGVSGRLGAASGERIDIIRSGLAMVTYGGTVTRGQKLTANASGQAIATAPAAGTNNQIIGIAEVSGVSGDTGSVLLTQSVMQG